jgi:hypothetical protein
MKHVVFGLAIALAAIQAVVRSAEPTAATLEDLKKLDIICLVPSDLPAGFKLKNVQIFYDEGASEEDRGQKFPLYSIEWATSPSRTGINATFSIECAREEIGDRNIMKPRTLRMLNSDRLSLERFI